MQVRLARRLAAFNRVVTNPVQGVYAWLLPPWAVIVHVGRRSGRVYRTPVLAVRRGEELWVHLFYGAGSDWVRNLLAAGGGSVVRGGRTYRLSDVRVVDRRAGPRLVARVHGPPEGGFGRGPGR
jgi:deazaflavin-dependent oxidoreductase (nitroreductase family)